MRKQSKYWRAQPHRRPLQNRYVAYADARRHDSSVGTPTVDGHTLVQSTTNALLDRYRKLAVCGSVEIVNDAYVKSNIVRDAFAPITDRSMDTTRVLSFWSYSMNITQPRFALYMLIYLCSSTVYLFISHASNAKFHFGNIFDFLRYSLCESSRVLMVFIAKNPEIEQPYGQHFENNESWRLAIARTNRLRVQCVPKNISGQKWGDSCRYRDPAHSGFDRQRRRAHKKSGAREGLEAVTAASTALTTPRMEPKTQEFVKSAGVFVDAEQP